MTMFRNSIFYLLQDGYIYMYIYIIIYILCTVECRYSISWYVFIRLTHPPWDFSASLSWLSNSFSVTVPSPLESNSLKTSRIQFMPAPCRHRCNWDFTKKLVGWSPEKWSHVQDEAPKIEKQVALELISSKWLKSMVYGKYNELVNGIFMGFIILTNKENWGTIL